MSTPQLTPGQAAILEDIFDSPEPVETRNPERNTANISALTDSDLADLIQLLLAEQHERAVEQADPEALTKDAYERMFNGKGDAMEPELIDGILVCAGSLKNLSTTSHVCSFVHVDEHWCWDHPDLLNDDVRKIPVKGRDHQRSISLIPVQEGTEVDFVTCKATAREGHRAQKSTSYVVTNGKLEVTDTRSVASHSHGRR